MAKKNFLYPADWVKTKPYMAVDSVDIYYTGIANRIYDILKETKLDAIFNTPHSMRTAVMSLTGWFEDVISQNGIWQAFTNECEQMYGKKLPFYPLGDNYYPDEINQEDIQFLLWHNLQTVTRTQRIINPTSPVLMLAAEFIYHMLEDEYETAPENERLHQFIYASVDKEVACAHYVEVATWFHYKSFINIENFDEFMTVNGVIMAINAKGQPVKERTPFKAAPQPAPLHAEDYMSQDILSSGNMPTMARMVAQEIYDIRDSRNQLSRGEADFMPKDGEQLKIMLAQLNTQERALTQAFEGTTVKDTTEQVVTIIPEKGQDKMLAFRFSRHFGLTDNDDLSGAPYYAVVEDEHIIDELETTNDEKKKKDDLVIGVNLPGKIKVNIVNDGRTVAQYSTYAAQYGRVELLSGALFGKKITSHIVLNPVTGNVISLKTEPLE